MEGWEASGGLPGVRGTLCGDRCRCDLIPDDLDATRLQKEIDKMADRGFKELTDKMKAGLKLDLMRGGKVVLLKNFSQIKGILTVPYGLINEMELLIGQWKMLNGTLPASFFKLADVSKMIAWLRARI